MSTSANVSAGRSIFSLSIGRMRNWFRKHPEWWVCCIFIFAWIYIACNSFMGTGGQPNSGHFIYCMSDGTERTGLQPAAVLQSIGKKEDFFSGMGKAISNDMVPWILMVIAMMFPLLNEPVRHVAFSVRRKDRNAGILVFLTGYTITWAMAGLLFFAAQFFLNRVAVAQTPLVNAIIMASGFILAAVLSWLPVRPVLLARCRLTIPISIHGFSLYRDSLQYGLQMGLICLAICWAPMAALLLTHHNLILMYAVTIVLFYERYLLSHTSKVPGYAWVAMALILWYIEQ